MHKLIVLLSLTLSFNVFSHGSGVDPQETLRPISSMIPIPMRIGTDGHIQWGYHIDFSGGHGHGGHGGGHSSHHGGGMNMDHGSDMGMDHGSDMSVDHGNDMGMGHDGGMNMDHGSDMGMDHGNDMDMGNDDEDMSHHEEEDSKGGKHSSGHDSHGDEWMYMFMPMLTLGYDSYTRVINLTEDMVHDEVVELGTSTNGYVAVQNKSIQYGGGFGIMAMPPVDIPMFSFKLSLMPYKGGHVFRLKNIKEKSEVSKINTMVIPNTLADLNSWSINDRMSYSTRGGIMFGAGFGFSVLASAMQTYMAEGTWVTTVSKASDTSVLVSLRKGNMKMFAKRVMNMLVDLSVSEMKHIDKDFNFIFDLSNETGSEACKRMLNGDLLFAQEAISKNISGVEFVRYAKSDMRGTSRSRTVGLPYVFNHRKATGKMETFSEVHNGFTGGKSESHMTMYKSSVETDGILSDHKDSGVMFMGMVNKQLETSDDNVGVAGIFKWYFERSKTSNRFFNGQLNKLYTTFGFDKAKELKIPTLKNMGYIKAEVDLVLNAKDLMTLLNNYKKGMSKNMKENSLSKMNEFFKTTRNYRSFCGKLGKLSRCKSKIYGQTTFALQKIETVIAEMNEEFRLNNLKTFSQKLGKLGQLAMTNRFVLQEVFKSAGKSEVSAVLKLQGSRILKTKINL